VRVSDEHGRAVRAAGLGSWLARLAPARARGLVSVALVSDHRVRALNRTYRRQDYSTDVLSFPASAGATNPRAMARPASPRLPRARSSPIHQATAGPSDQPPPRRRRSAEASAKVEVPPARRRAVPGFLGDIVIARGVARQQAREAGHSELTELRVLALHGLLHLLGYDHDRDNGRMLRIERRLRQKGGLREGLIERASR
jgi:probable rRNA maturation factor